MEFTDIAKCASRHYCREGHPSSLFIVPAKKPERGDGIYLIPFAPHAFVLAVSGGAQCSAFAFGVPNDINAFHCYSVRSKHLFAPLVWQYLPHFRG